MDFTLNAATVISAPPERVFELITDIDRLPDWNAEITEVVERNGEVAVGAEWVVEIRAMRTRWNSRSTVVELDPEVERFAYRSRSDDGNPSYAEWQWDVTDDPAGSAVSVSMEAHPRSFWRRHLLARLRPKGLQAAMDRSLGALADLVRDASDATRT